MILHQTPSNLFCAKCRTVEVRKCFTRCTTSSSLASLCFPCYSTWSACPGEIVWFSFICLTSSLLSCCCLIAIVLLLVLSSRHVIASILFLLLLLLFVVCCLLFVVCCLLFVVCCFRGASSAERIECLDFLRFWLNRYECVLCVVCCVLCVVCCVLCVVCCVLCVVCCVRGPLEGSRRRMQERKDIDNRCSADRHIHELSYVSSAVLPFIHEAIRAIVPLCCSLGLIKYTSPSSRFVFPFMCEIGFSGLGCVVFVVSICSIFVLSFVSFSSGCFPRTHQGQSSNSART